MMNIARLEARRVARAGAMLGAITVMTSLASAAPARADEKTACVTAYERSQVLRKEGKLRRAREELRTCSRGTCPALVRTDCVAWLDQVESSYPSIVIRAEKDGADVAAVRVVEDNEVIATRLDGKAIELEPGEHVFRFETDGAPPVSLTMVVHEAEKNRVVPVHFAGPHKEPLASAASADGADTTSRPVPVGVYALGGVGLAGLAGFTVLGAIGKSNESSLKSSCSPNCAKSDIDSVRAKYLAADVSLAIGVASLATAAIWYLARPTEHAPSALTAFTVSPTPSGASLSYASTF
jgi:hypothetical protein